MPPPNPTEKELLTWSRNHPKYWNAGDRQAWIDNYRSVLATDAVRMLDPVGTPEKFGFQHCLVDSFDLFQSTIKFHIPEETLFVNGNSVGWVMHNIITSSGETSTMLSIETYHFEPDGSLAIRTWYRLPHGAGGDLGRVFSEYLPDDYQA